MVERVEKVEGRAGGAEAALEPQREVAKALHEVGKAASAEAGDLVVLGEDRGGGAAVGEAHGGVVTTEVRDMVHHASR